MNTALRLIALLVVFAIGYTMGQGHEPFDYTGDDTVDNSDVRAVGDRLFDRQKVVDK